MGSPQGLRTSASVSGRAAVAGGRRSALVGGIVAGASAGAALRAGTGAGKITFAEGRSAGGRSATVAQVIGRHDDSCSRSTRLGAVYGADLLPDLRGRLPFALLIDMLSGRMRLAGTDTLTSRS